MLKWFVKLMRRNWPIKIYVFKKYENTLKIVEGKGRRVRVREKLDEGETFYDYFEFYTEDDVMSLKKIPTQGIQHAKNIDGVTTLYLYQVDLDTYYPIKVSDKSLTVSIEKEDGTQEKIIFDPKLIIDEDKAIYLPYFVAEKTYDKDSWLSQQIVLSNELFKRSKGFFEKYGPYMVSIISVFVIFVVVLYSINKMANMFEDTNKALITASENFEKSARYFEVFGKIIEDRYGNSNQNPQPQLETPQPPP